MKKIFIVFAAAAALAMISCSKDETRSVNLGDGITFRPAMGTRAVETTIGNLESFNVTALTGTGESYFTDATFTKNSSTGTYTTNPVYYWPSTGSLSFYAYAPSTLSGVTINQTTKSVTITPDTAIADQIDFITANATGNKADNEGSGVALVFGHRLSQIQVKALNSNTAYVFKVKGVKIGSVESTGTFDFASVAFTTPLSGTKADYMIKYDTEHTLTAEAVDIMNAAGTDVNGSAMLIPQQLSAWDPENDGSNDSENAYLSVLLNICTKDGAQIYPPAAGAYGWAAVGIGTDWEPGKRYVYTLNFSKGAGYVDPEGPDGGDPDPSPDPDPDNDRNPGEDILGEAIQFTVSVSDWEDADPQPGIEL